MKTIITVSLILLGSFVFGQTKGDSKIIVKASDTVNLLNRVAAALVDNGYSLDKKDRELSYITTDAKKLTKWRPEMKIMAQIKGSEIMFSGSADTKGRLATDGLHSSGTFDPIVYTSKANIMIYCWNELVKIAGQFGTLSFK